MAACAWVSRSSRCWRRWGPRSGPRASARRARWREPRAVSQRRARQGDASDGTRGARSVREAELAAVRLDDVARQHEPDPAAALLRREQRHEQVVWVEDAGALVRDREHHLVFVRLPVDADAAARL